MIGNFVRVITAGVIVLGLRSSPGASGSELEMPATLACDRSTAIASARPLSQLQARAADALPQCVLGLGSSAATAQPGVLSARSATPMPANIEAPQGHIVFFKAHAVGTQNYMCLPTASGVSWKFVAPQATLFQTFLGEIHQQLATHFLSANASENGLPRPTWQHSFDSSRVWARALASSTDANYVEAGAIPWLLLTVVGSERGSDGGSFLTQAAFIQRLNTAGGSAPSTGCSQSTEFGALALVPYAADYFFYRASPGR